CGYDFRKELAGVGGDVKFLRSTEDFRYYQEVAGDTVAMLRTQGGYVTPWGGQQLPLLNSFFGGPDLVRGFAVNGFGPRDVTEGTSKDNVGGTRYWATTAELRTPLPWSRPRPGCASACLPMPAACGATREQAQRPRSRSRCRLPIPGRSVRRWVPA